MDEQLEHALEGAGAETAVHKEAAVQVPSPDPTPEKQQKPVGKKQK